ncbi:MAG: class I SAM-dependent methyltransferase [Alphaproteobacteria bacterium]|nr:class I SAM-dependent methyltransferase [Alphaproteobacteria bacterium]
MGRARLFEWEDQPWLPRDLRDIVTDHLRFAFSAPGAVNMRETVADILEPPLRRSGSDTIVDVCSGGGGPLPAALPLLSARLGPLKATLTDLYPNTAAFGQLAKKSEGALAGETRSISAFDVPAELGRFQTLFTAFHHFKPEDAKRILADAASKGRTIVVIEPFKRRDFWIVTFGGFLRGLVLTPVVGELTLARLLWTYPIPISPFVVAWDGAVSCLRAYGAPEMEALGREAAPSYHWEAGERPIPGPLKLSITYLIGEPEAVTA